MGTPVVKVSREEFERFLERQGKTWDVDGNPGFHLFVSVEPLTTADLMSSIAAYAPDDDSVYVFPPGMVPADAIKAADFDNLPTADAQQLEEYVVHDRAKEFLCLACSMEEASSGQPLTLLTDEEAGFA
jgi:hypothetical protein